MKKFLSVIFMIALVLGVSMSADAAVRHFTAEVVAVDDTGTETPITSGIGYQVLAVDSDTEETLGSDKLMTSKTNFVTSTVFDTQDKIDFWCDPTDSDDVAVDLLVWDNNGGYTVFIEDFRYDKHHKVVIDKTTGGIKMGRVPYECQTVSTEVDTGIDFNYDSAILAADIEVVTGVDANLDVGLLSTEGSGDADGLLDYFRIASAGYVAHTIGSSGALMDSTDFYMNGHRVTGANAKSLCYTCSATDADGAGYIYYRFTDIRP
jgi:hypothetical protein